MNSSRFDREDSDLRRLQAAEAFLSRDKVSSNELVIVLSSLLELLDQRVLLEAKIEGLDGVPVAMLALPMEEISGARTGKQRSGGNEVYLGIALRGGRLVQARLFEDEGGRWRLDILGMQRVEGFVPGRDWIVGLYWTRKATPFRERRDLILVVRQEGEIGVYQWAIGEPLEQPLHRLGDRVPKWMEVCPVAASPDHDMLAEPPRENPHADARGAAWKDGTLFSAVRALETGREESEGSLWEGEGIHLLENDLVILRQDPAIECWRIRKDPPSRLWSFRLTRQPVALSSLPTGSSRRVLVGFEGGELALLIDVGPERVRKAWLDLIERIEQQENLHGYPDYVEWARHFLESEKVKSDRRQVAMVLRVLVEKLPGTARERRRVFGEEVAELFRQPLTAEEFQPVLSLLRKIIRSWAEGRGDKAEVVWDIYCQLTYELQDHLDLELQRLPQIVTSEAEAEGLENLLERRDFNRAGLLKDPEIESVARLALWGEEWLEPFILHQVLPSPSDTPARLRFVLDEGRGLVVHPHGFYWLDLESDNQAAFQEATPEEWFRPTRSALVIQTPDASKLASLVIANKRRMARIELSKRGRSRVVQDYRLPEGCSLASVADAGAGLLFLTIRREGSLGRFELWLFSWPQVDVLASQPVEGQIPRELAVLPLERRRRWWVVMDVAEEEIALLDVSFFDAASDLRFTILASRRVSGRVRSLDAARQTGGWPRAVVGTTEGFVSSFQLDGGSSPLEFEWIYRLRGSARHLNMTSRDGWTMALSTAGEVVVLDGPGRPLWRRRLPTPLHSGRIFQVDGQSRVGTIDIEGEVRTYRETRADSTWHDLKRRIEALEASREDLGEANNARSENAYALHLLTKDPVPWEQLETLQTETGRSCFLRRLGEHLVSREDFQSLEPALRGVVRECRLQELQRFGRFISSEASPEAREGVAKILLEELAYRGDERRFSELEEARELLAGLVSWSGLPLSPSLFQEESGWEWWARVPATIREDVWVLSTLLLVASRPAESKEIRFATLVVEATHLGPEAFQVLPWLAPSDFQEAASETNQAVQGIASDLGELEALHQVRDRSAGGDEAIDFFRLLIFLAERDTSWEEFLDITRPKDLEGQKSALHPAIRELVELGAHYRELDEERFGRARVAEQLQHLDELLDKEIPHCEVKAGEWQGKIDKARERFQIKVREQLETRRRELRERQWVRIEDLKVELLGSSKLVLIVAKLERDGRDRPEAKVRIRMPDAGKGIRPLTENLSWEWTWEEVPEEVSFSAFLDEGVTTVVFESVTELEGETHSFNWRAPAPARVRFEGESFFDRLGDLATQLIKPLLGLDKGVHLLAVARELGIVSMVTRLLQAEGSHPIALDEALAEVGPGRADVSGFTAERILAALEGRKRPSGQWRIPKGAGRRRIVLYPADETALRLTRPESRPVLGQLAELLKTLEGPPVCWLLPIEIAAELHGRLPSASFHPLYRVDAAGKGLEGLLRWAVERTGRKSDELRSIFRTFGGHLRLFVEWADQSGEKLGTPQDFLRRTGTAQKILEDDLTGLGLRARGHLAVMAAARTRLNTRRDLASGMVADETVLSSATTGRKKELVSAGRRIDGQSLSNLASDPGHHEALRVRGLHLESKGVLVPDSLQVLWQAITRPSTELLAFCRRMEQRRIVSLDGNVARVLAPLVRWIAKQLEDDPSGLGFVEPDAGDLFWGLTLEELAGAGEGLPALLPKVDGRSVDLLQRLGSLYRTPDPSRDAVEEMLEALTRRKVSAVEESQELQQVGAELGEILPPETHLFIVQRPEEVARHLMAFVLQTPSVALETDLRRAVQRDEPKLVLTLWGPGVSRSPFTDFENLCVLDQSRFKEILKASGPARSFWRAIRNRVGLAPFSPYQVGNFLAEDSPVFVGREEETGRILTNISTTSFLIVGGRQIGKTSLLRHIYGNLGRREDATCLWIDCAGLTRPDQVFQAVSVLAAGEGFELVQDAEPVTALELTLRRLRSPVLLLNEVDGLALGATQLLQRLRSLSESGVCQCVMVGYHGAAAGLQDPDHPFYHWVQGRVGEKAFVLGALSNAAAHDLVGKLTDTPLELRWESDEARGEGANLLLSSSHRIPILLQKACQRLVDRLDREGRMEIRLADVEKELQTESNPAWEYLQGTRLALPTAAGGKDPTHEEVLWGDLVLAAVVEVLFFRPEPPPLADPRLRERPPAELSFTPADARLYVRRVLRRARLYEDELQRVEERFPKWVYGQLLEGLTLTVVLAPAPEKGRAYQFSDFIYPLELERHLRRQDKDIGNYILGLVSDLIENI